LIRPGGEEKGDESHNFGIRDTEANRSNSSRVRTLKGDGWFC